MSKRNRVTSKRVTVVLAAAAAISAIGTGAAGAQVSPGAGGGTVAPGEPQVLSIQCVTKCIGLGSGVVKSRVRLLGTDLANTTVVSFSRADGTRAKDAAPVVRPSGSVISFVPKGAVTGTVRVADSFGQVADSTSTFTVGTLQDLKALQMQYRFPIQGAHDYGDAAARFGSGRDGHTHQGQDVFAACGTPLVAPHAGIVEFRGFQSAAGNYLVIDGAGVKEDYVMMHLKGPAKVAAKQSVSPGQLVGRVGATGDASGCHLHFELWPGKGWYTGGAPADPLATLQYWDSFS